MAALTTTSRLRRRLRSVLAGSDGAWQERASPKLAEEVPLPKRPTSTQPDHRAGTALAPEDLTGLSRAQLTDAAAAAPSPETVFQVFHVLFRLGNFRSAGRAASHLDLSRLDDGRALLVARAMLSSDRGVEGDRLVEARLKAHSVQPPIRTLGSFGAAVSVSGWPLERKVETLRAFLRHLEESEVDNVRVRRSLKWTLFKLIHETGRDVDLPYFAELDRLDTEDPAHQLRFVEQMRLHGRDEDLGRLLDVVTERYGQSRLELLIAQLSLDPLWLDKQGLEIPDLAEHTGQLALLRVAAESAGASERTAALYRACVERQRTDFPNRDIVSRNAFLAQLARADEINLVLALADEHDLPDTILPVTSCRALRYFMIDDYLSAKDLFGSVLDEDPANSLASEGLRLTLPRTGAPIGEMFEVRRRIGHGIQSAGRAGACIGVGAEITTSLLMSGNYRRGLYAKRHARQWRYLKSVLGGRFLNYERLPRAEDRTLFVIGDEGIGDELRTAQFYRELADRFGKVTISCDPRLQALLKRSFPQIEFLPVLRYRRGLHDRHGRLGTRLAGVPVKLQHLLTEETRPLIEGADVVTFGQNLFFNHFIGEIGRAVPGAYIETPARRLAGEGKLRVGLLWRSHLRTLWRKFMYLGIEDFAPLTELDGVELWSIQHAIDDDERRFCEAHGIRLIEDVDLFNDFEGLARYLKSLDLAIGLSSAPLELAAAVGTPVWMLGFSPENYFLRTKGGRTSEDQLTCNSTVVAPPWIDFTAPRQECIDLVFKEVHERLTRDIRSR